MRADAKRNYDSLLAVAREVFIEQGAEASLRDVARRAEVGLGTLYRHFPSREALLEALLGSGFDALTRRARELEHADSPDEALLSWMQETTELTHSHRGVIAVMMSAIEDPESALHVACVALRAAGAALLSRAQRDGTARADLDGAELFDLIAALAWLREQPAHASRAAHLFEVIAGAVLSKRPRVSGPKRRAPQ
ncbi:TetR/AcrR family transcriptional regulator [Chitinasiproducens palmae]|uniref:Regulatory protein, tetR family n=1 Tax=Chitinasiproducens palmae TaxID=1770053 RepID=A0A1H2PLJ3_9BURK|nr:TetR/AcrR family transcriptional regulator [Chitinasiproducens palmae]SDV47354.1 regulatory protein, tetR family [Chitinasiproducens palmae]